MPDRMPRPYNPAHRWWILAFLSLLMFGNYYDYDMIAPVAGQLESELGFSNTQIGALNAIYSLPNIFLLLICGVIIDRFGASRVTLWTTLLCLIGTAMTAWNGEFMTMAAGRLLFGIGSDTMITAVTVACAIWFARGGVAFAMALSLSIARAGSYAADLSPVWAADVYAQGWQPPFILATGFAAFAFVFAMLYRWADERWTHPPLPEGSHPTRPDKIRWREILRFGPSYWYIMGLCVLFYSVIIPYRSTFSIKFFQHAFDLELSIAATINSMVYLTTIFVTPVFGLAIDRWGHRALLMVLGSLLLPVSFLGVVVGGGGLWFSTILLGICYSAIPAILWPAVVKLVDQNRLGTAYALLFMLQNAGVMVANLVAGGLNDGFKAGPENPSGYVPMVVFFAAIAVGALFFAIALWRREKGPHSHGLELPGALRPMPGSSA